MKFSRISSIGNLRAGNFREFLKSRGPQFIANPRKFAKISCARKFAEMKKDNPYKLKSSLALGYMYCEALDACYSGRSWYTMQVYVDFLCVDRPYGLVVFYEEYL